MAETASGAGRVAQNSAALLAARIVSAGATLVATPFLFSMLGPRQFGVWALLVGLFAIAGLADLGFGSAQVREVAQSLATGDRRRAQAALALALAFFGALGLGVLAVASLAWGAIAAAFDLGALSDDGGRLAILLALAFLVEALSTPWRAVLEGSQRMVPLAAATAVSAAFAAALGTVFVAAGLGLPGLGWAALVAAAVRAAALVGASARMAPGLKPRFRSIRRDDVRPLLHYCGRVQVSNATAAVNLESDRVVLGVFFASATVASFDIGAKLVNALKIVPSLVLAALFPLVAATHARGRQETLDEIYARATRYLALFAAVTGAALVVSAEPLVTLWIGEPLPFAVTTVMLLAPAYAVNLVSGAATAVTRAEGEPGRETRYTVVAAALNVVLTVPLLVWLGAVGVPVATTIAYVAATAYFFWHFHRASARPLVPLLRSIWKPFAAAGLAAVLVWVAGDLLPDAPGRAGAALSIACRAGLATLLAGIGLVLLGFFDAGDRAQLRRLAAKTRLAAPAPRLPLGTEGERAR